MRTMVRKSPWRESTVSGARVCCPKVERRLPWPRLPHDQLERLLLRQAGAQRFVSAVVFHPVLHLGEIALGLIRGAPDLRVDLDVADDEVLLLRDRFEDEAPL